MAYIGLTGGVGSGKSTVAQLFRQAGALVIDADAIAREVVAPGEPALAEIRAHFGDGVIRADGSLDRSALADIVFHDADELAVLNSITHPRIAQRTARLHQSAKPGQHIVHDVPLLVENQLADAYDVVVVVWAEPEVRLARLAARGMSTAEAQRRMAAQATDAQRREVADLLIDNNGDVDQLRAHVAEVLSQLAEVNA